MVPVYAGIGDYLDAIRETWATGRDVLFIAGRGCDHLEGEDVIHLDCDDTYLGLIQKMGAGYRWMRENREFDYLVKVDPDTYVFPEYEARVDMMGKDLHGFGSAHSSIVGCCVAYSERAVARLIDVHDGNHPELSPIHLSYLLTRLGTRDRLYPSEDTFATMVISSLLGKKSIYSDIAICTGHHTQVHTTKVKKYTTAFMELSPDGLRRVHANLGAPDRLAVLDNALRSALICERCSFREQLSNGGQRGVLGSGGCVLMDEPFNHFLPGGCPKGKHA